MAPTRRRPTPAPLRSRAAMILASRPGPQGSGRQQLAAGSATVTQFPPTPATTARRSSLRSANASSSSHSGYNSTSRSPDAQHVRFADAVRGRNGSLPRNLPPVTRRATARVAAGAGAGVVVNAPKRSTTRKQTATTKSQTSPVLRFSPRTAQRAKAAAEYIQQQVALLDEKIDSPPPMSSKTTNFRGTGFRVRTGLPPSPENAHHHDHHDGRVQQTPARVGVAATGLPTSPATNGADTATTANTAAANSSSPTPKNITITQDAANNRQIYVDGVSDWLAFPTAPHAAVTGADGDAAIEIPTKALLEHAASVKQNLRGLSLEEIHIQLYLLQKMIRQWSKRHFRDAWPLSRMQDFNLADLSTAHPPFYRAAAYLADGSSFRGGWADFLTSEQTRPYVAYAIVSEWLRYNVFGHSCFGLSEDEDARMTRIDVQYLHYDGFVRTKERAKLLARILAHKPQWERELDMDTAVDMVAADLMTVLEPILPEGCKAAMRKQLQSLIDVAANLHQCIRLTGRDGTVMRFHSSSKGDRFAYTARQNCINKSTVTKTVDDMIAHRNAKGKTVERNARVRDRLLIKMPCFPLVMATVPFGPTLRDFAVEQKHYEKTIRSPDLPAVSTQGVGPMFIEDVPAEIVRAALFEEMPESCKKDYGRRRPGRGDDTLPQEFGSYVKQYVLNESDVYCEWEFDGEVPGGGHGLTLRQAVEQAQREKYGYVPAERRARRMRLARNIKYGAIGAAGLAMAYGVAKHTGLISAALSTTKKLKLPGNLSVQDIKGAVQSVVKVADAKMKLFRSAAARPFKIGKAYAAHHFGGVTSRFGGVQSKASAATSVLKDILQPEETAVAPPSFPIQVEEVLVKVGVKIPKIIAPKSRVTKVTSSTIKKQTTKLARSVAHRLYERFGRRGRN